MQLITTLQEKNMANPLGTVAMQTHRLASVYFKKFHNLMKSGRINKVVKLTIT
jgi:hypothetical protein